MEKPRWMRWLLGERSKDSKKDKEDELKEVRRRTDQIVKEQEARKEQAETEGQPNEPTRQPDPRATGGYP